jgi:endonuclease YncB( thermonuclease family)
MILLKRYLPILLIPLFLPAFSFADQFKVARVVDGDTIKVSRDDTTITVRLVGIDAQRLQRERMNRVNHLAENPPNILPVLC